VEISKYEIRVADPHISPRDFGKRETLRLSQDKEKLQQVLAGPQSWQTIETLGPELDLRPVKMLWQRPMAMHTAGVCLQRLSISPFPVKGNSGKLCPYKKSSAGGDEEEDWKSLEAALQGIRTMNFEPGLDRMQHGHGSLLGEHISVQNQHYVNNFVSALTCSTALEQVYINFSRLGLKPGEVASWRRQIMWWGGRI